MDTHMKRIILAALLVLTSAASAGTAVLTWTAPTLNTDGTAIVGPITYKLYRGLSGAAKTLLTTTAAGAVTFTDAAAPVGTVCYEITANVGGIESAHSGEACKVIAPPVPNPPTGLTVAQNTAFKMRQAVDAFSFVSIGTVPLGSPCIDALAVEDATGRYTPVSRSLVTLRNRYDTLPLVAYAKCA